MARYDRLLASSVFEELYTGVRSTPYTRYDRHENRREQRLCVDCEVEDLVYRPRLSFFNIYAGLALPHSLPPLLSRCSSLSILVCCYLSNSNMMPDIGGNIPHLLSHMMSTGITFPPLSLVLMAMLVFYLALVSALRRHTERTLKRDFHYPDRASLAKMTLSDAWLIQHRVATQEFPFCIIASLKAAVFQVVGIPVVSGLLVKTNKLGTDGIHKRYTDTTIMIAEFFLNPPTAKRTVEAISRMNYIHSVYQKAGKIKNDEMLYILSLFAINPIKWVKTFEWRELNDMEKCAMATYWKSIGDDMKIDYSPLPSYSSGWTDGLHWLEEIWAWSEAYEERSIARHETNAAVGQAALQITVWKLPNALKPLARHAIASILDERLRESLLIPEPPKAIQLAVKAAIESRRFMLRYLCLPRTYYRRHKLISERQEKNGRYYLLEYDSLPYYIKPTVFNRWGPFALLQRWLGLELPGDDGEKYGPDGYVLEDLGPAWMFGVKRDERNKQIKAMVEQMASQRKLGCPFR
ncbi:hypothetical protein VTN02DRAFT_2106 [Thermoascus thermophilus]